MTNPIVKSFWDKPTGSWQYVFHDPKTMKGAIIDPVLDFDPLSGETWTENAELLLAYVKDAGIDVTWVLDRRNIQRFCPFFAKLGTLSWVGFGGCALPQPLLPNRN